MIIKQRTDRQGKALSVRLWHSILGCTILHAYSSGWRPSWTMCTFRLLLQGHPGSTRTLHRHFLDGGAAAKPGCVSKDNQVKTVPSLGLCISNNPGVHFLGPLNIFLVFSDGAMIGTQIVSGCPLQGAAPSDSIHKGSGGELIWSLCSRNDNNHRQYILQ